MEIVLLFCFIGLLIAGLLGFILFVEYMAKYYPDTAIGRFCKRLNHIMENMPDD